MTAPSRRKDKPCRTCSTMLRRDNASGFCARCVKASPEYRAKVAAGARKRYADPAERERTGLAMRRAYQRDPTIAERKAERMREIAATPEWQERNRANCTDRRLWEKGLAARTPQSHARQGRTFSKRHGLAAWCPVVYLEMARELRRSGVPLPDVKRMVADQQARDHAHADRAANHRSKWATVEPGLGSRDPCPRCGAAGINGCAHRAPFQPVQGLTSYAGR